MSSSGSSLGDQIKSGIKGIHGVGEAIRGTVMNETDKAFGTHDPNDPTKNAAIAEQGLHDMKAADQNVGHNHGIKSTTAAAGPDANTAPATGAGAHSTAPGSIRSTGGGIGSGAGGVQEQPGVNQRF